MERLEVDLHATLAVGLPKVKSALAPMEWLIGTSREVALVPDLMGCLVRQRRAC